MKITIQIDEDTKKKLFKIRLKLEEQKRSAVTYNEIIKFLIDNQSSNMIKKENLKEFRKLKGILPKSVMNLYLEEKKKDLLREEERTDHVREGDDV